MSDELVLMLGMEVTPAVLAKVQAMGKDAWLLEAARMLTAADFVDLHDEAVIALSSRLLIFWEHPERYAKIPSIASAKLGKPLPKVEE